MTALLIGLPGVLLEERSPAHARRVEWAAGTDQRLWDIYEDLLPAFDRGDISEERFWRQIQIRLGTEPFDIPEAIAADWEGQTVVNAAAVTALRDLLNAGVCCAIVANVPAGLAKHLRHELIWLEDVDALTFSSDIGLRLPDVRALAVAVDAMGANLKDAVYIASPAEIAAAREEKLPAGLRLMEYRDPETLRGFLP